MRGSLSWSVSFEGYATKEVEGWVLIGEFEKKKIRTRDGSGCFLKWNNVGLVKKATNRSFLSRTQTK